jgi:hypothetical protein
VAYTLGDGAKSVLHKAISACTRNHVIPTPARVLDRVHDIPDQERVRGWKISVVRALESILASNLVSDGATQERMMRALLGQSTIVELDALSPSTKAFLLPLVCLWVYQVRLASSVRERLSLVLVVEEAHHVLYTHQSGHETTMELLLRQCRELGIGIIVVDQHPHLLSSAALGNTYTTICLNLKDPTDTAKAARLLLLSSEDARHLSTLPVGRGVVKLQDRWHEPVLVDFPLVPVEKGRVTDAVLRSYLDGKATLSAVPPAPAVDLGSLGRPRLADEARFLTDVAAYPNDGVDARYQRLKMSPDTGTRAKRRLLALGLIEEARVRIGRTHRHLVRLTTSARQVIAPNGEQQHESLAHEYWKRRYADTYRANDYAVQVEAPRPSGGRVDVLATRTGESVAIEIETGKSNAVENVRRDLLAGYTRVVVIATTDQAWARVRRQLDSAGLLLARVTVVLREGGTLSK